MKANEQATDREGFPFGRWLRTSKLQRLLDHHIGVSILLTVVLGIALLTVAIWTYTSFCGPRSPWVLSYSCKAIRDNPPWTLLTAVAAAPSAILTWYWRTYHKQRDIEGALSTERNARFAKMIELLGKGEAGAIFALAHLASEAPDDYHWQVMQTLAAAVRGWSSPKSPEYDTPQQFVRIQAAIQMIGQRQIGNDPPLARLDLSATTLANVDFRRLRFRHAMFTRANLSRADFQGGDFDGAVFTGAALGGARLKGGQFQGASFLGATFDEHTEYDLHNTPQLVKEARDVSSMALAGNSGVRSPSDEE